DVDGELGPGDADSTLNVRIAGKEVSKAAPPAKVEVAAAAEEELEEDEYEEEEVEEETDEEAEETEEVAAETEAESKPSLGSRLKTALRIKAPPAKSERDEVMEELN